MARIVWFCFPLCLILAPSYPGATRDVSASAHVQHVTETGKTVEKGIPHPAVDVLGFLPACLKKYDDNVQGYTLSFWKQERINGKLNPLEIIDVAYRDKPYTVFFNWTQGERLAKRCLYVEGEHRDAASGKCLMQVMPAGPLKAIGVVKRDPDGADAKKSGRYPISAFGLRQATERVLNAMNVAKENKTLDVKYQGLNKVQETGGQVCYTIVRNCAANPEEDGVAEVVIYIDRETLLQVGTILKNVRGELIATYYFKDIRLNPTFEPNRFETAALK